MCGHFGIKLKILQITMLILLGCLPSYSQGSKIINYLPDRIISKEAKYFHKAQKKFELPCSDSLYTYWEIWYDVDTSLISDEKLTVSELATVLRNAVIQRNVVEATMNICNKHGYNVAAISSYGNYYKLYQKSARAKYCYESDEKYLVYLSGMDGSTNIILKKEDIWVLDFFQNKLKIMKWNDFVKCCWLVW